MRYLLLLLGLLTSGCMTRGVLLSETPLGISETRRVIVSVVGEPRHISQNGREMRSQYYDANNRFIQQMDMAAERYYTHTIILGDRRPYNVQVMVKFEERTEYGNFEYVEDDEGRADAVAAKIEEALHQSRDGRNIIDDFRSF